MTGASGTAPVPEESDPPPRRSLIALLLVIGVGVAVRLNLIGIPINRDEGSFAYVGNMLKHGGRLYRDALDHKPPGIWLYYWLFSYVIDFHAVSLHLLLLVYNLLTLLLIVAFVRRLASVSASLWAGLVYAVLSSAWQVEGYSASTEMLLLPLIVGSLALCVCGLERKRGLCLGAAGVLGACCFWTKQPTMLIGGFAAIYLFVRSYRERGGNRPVGRRLLSATRPVLALLFGFAVPSGILCGVFLVTDRWSDFAYWAFLHNLEYATSSAWQSYLLNLWQRISDTVLSNPAAWGFALAGCALQLRRRRPWGWLMSGFLLTSLVAACHSSFMYRHYMALVVPSVSIAAGFGIATFMGAWRGRPRSKGVAAVAIVGGVAILPLLLARGYYVSNTPAQNNTFLYNVNPFTESPRIAAYLAGHTSPGEPVLILGSEPQILVLADRPSATRHLFMYQVVGAYRRAARSQQQMLDDIARAKPNYVVLVNLRSSWLAERDASGQFQTRLMRWLTGTFLPVAVVDRAASELVDLAEIPAPAREVAVNKSKVVVLRRAERPPSGQ